MNHPADLSRTLASLEGTDLHTLAHLLSCSDCALKAQRLLNDEPGATGGALSTQELARLERLADQLRRGLEGVNRFVLYLQRKPAPVHFLVRSRLECLITDHLSPAVRDLASIGETARGNHEAGAFK